MRDIFSDLYDKVLSFFAPATPPDESKNTAKNRLRSVLAQDRVGFSERAMQMLKDDMIDVISKYLEIDTSSFDLSLNAEEECTIMNFAIPVLRPKTDEEIDEALAIARQTTIEKTEEIVDELKELVHQKAQELVQNMSEKDKEKDNQVSDETEEDDEEETEEVDNQENSCEETNKSEESTQEISQNKKKKKKRKLQESHAKGQEA